MPRFVILLHETPPGYARATHFDLMLEHQEALRTWAVNAWPPTGRSAMAERLADHRLAYLDYEGALSGERGMVRRIDAGVFELIAVDAQKIVVQLHGIATVGRLVIESGTLDDQRCRISFFPDSAAAVAASPAASESPGATVRPPTTN